MGRRPPHAFRSRPRGPRPGRRTPPTTARSPQGHRDDLTHAPRPSALPNRMAERQPPPALAEPPLVETREPGAASEAGGQEGTERGQDKTPGSREDTGRGGHSGQWGLSLPRPGLWSEATAPHPRPLSVLRLHSRPPGQRPSRLRGLCPCPCPQELRMGPHCPTNPHTDRGVFTNRTHWGSQE